MDIKALTGLRSFLGYLLDQVEDGFINPRLQLYECAHAENLSHGCSQASVNALVCSRYKGRYQFAVPIILHGFVEIALFRKLCQLYWQLLPISSTWARNNLWQICLDAVYGFNSIWISDADNVRSNLYEFAMSTMELP